MRPLSVSGTEKRRGGRKWGMPELKSVLGRGSEAGGRYRHVGPRWRCTRGMVALVLLY